MSKNQLASPAGIDHDYNFLSGIERTLNRPETLPPEKCVRVRAPRNTSTARNELVIQSRGRNLQRHYRIAQVVVKNAPVGMSRQKLNKTQWNGIDRCIYWTVEWTSSTGTRKIGACDEIRTLADAYTHTFRPQLTKKERRRKRKRDNKMGSEESRPLSDQQPPPQSAGLQPCTEQVSRQSPEPESLAEPPAWNEADGFSSPESVHFYLHKAFTNSAKPVLIPVESSSTISACLRKRTILEFPTFYALPYPPDQLPQDYMSDPEYFKQESADNDVGTLASEGIQGDIERAELASGINDAESSSSEEAETKVEQEREEASDEEEGPNAAEMGEPILMPDGTALDQGKLLDVLKQDIG